MTEAEELQEQVTTLTDLLAVHEEQSTAQFELIRTQRRDLEERTRALDGLNRELRTQSDAIAELLAKENAARVAMQRLLDSVAQGFVTLDRTGALMSGRSAAFEQWFGAPSDGALFADCLRRLEPDAGDRFACGWLQIEEDLLPLELLIDQLPTKLAARGRHYRIEYTPTLDDAGRFANLFVVITDVTADVERECSEAQLRDLLVLMARFASDRDGFLAFFREADGLALAICATDQGAAELRRAVHTLKGISGLFGAHTVAVRCHDFESRIAEPGAPPSDTERAQLVSVWYSLRRRIESFLTDDQDMISIKRVELEDLQRMAYSLSSRQLASILDTWTWDSGAKRLSRLGAQAQALATKLGKGQIDVVVDSGGLRFQPQRWDAFWTCMAHLVSNGVDHGIEPADARAVLGKPDRARVTMRTFLADNHVVLEFSDDGRGIDWAAVASKARNRGIATSTKSSLIPVLFIDGVTTRDEATMHSGRGVGLAAVRAACDSMGGVISVESEPNRGTLFRFTMPAQGVVRGTIEPADLALAT